MVWDSACYLFVLCCLNFACYLCGIWLWWFICLCVNLLLGWLLRLLCLRVSLVWCLICILFVFLCFGWGLLNVESVCGFYLVWCMFVFDILVYVCVCWRVRMTSACFIYWFNCLFDCFGLVSLFERCCYVWYW